MAEDLKDGPPKKLRDLVSWQAGRVALLGTRLIAGEMPLEARADYAVLASLLEHGPLTQMGLGRTLGLDRKNLHGIVSRLAAGGSVTKRGDDADRRTTVVDITGRGRSYFTDLDQRAQRVQQQLLEPLETEERDQLIRLLAKIIRANPALPA